MERKNLVYLRGKGLTWVSERENEGKRRVVFVTSRSLGRCHGDWQSHSLTYGLCCIALWVWNTVQTGISPHVFSSISRLIYLQSSEVKEHYTLHHYITSWLEIKRHGKEEAWKGKSLFVFPSVPFVSQSFPAHLSLFLSIIFCFLHLSVFVTHCLFLPCLSLTPILSVFPPLPSCLTLSPLYLLMFHLFTFSFILMHYLLVTASRSPVSLQSRLHLTSGSFGHLAATHLL